MNKFELIINNKINGNLSDFEEQVKKLTKLDLLNLIEYWTGHYGTERHTIINDLRLVFEHV